MRTKKPTELPYRRKKRMPRSITITAVSSKTPVTIRHKDGNIERTFLEDSPIIPYDALSVEITVSSNYYNYTSPVSIIFLERELNPDE